jgi:adenosylcobinamide-phosphate synthase
MDQSSVQFIAISILIALAVDWYFGEPPNYLHPVISMGLFLNWATVHYAPINAEKFTRGSYYQLLKGALLWGLGAAATISIAFIFIWILEPFNFYIYSFLTGIVLSSLLSWRMLRNEVLAVSFALDQSLTLGREQVSRLVSRNVNSLTDIQVRESAIETLAENLNDSVIAPLFWFAVGGLPAAALYRFANTADAMWGYKISKNGFYWEWFGKCAAKVDDILSWIPAMLTALFIFLIARVSLFRALLTESRKTPSPNGGWPMGAMALVLGLKLSKSGVYELNPQGRAPGAGDIQGACRIGDKMIVFISLLCGLLLIGSSL